MYRRTIAAGDLEIWAMQLALGSEIRYVCAYLARAQCCSAAVIPPGETSHQVVSARCWHVETTITRRRRSQHRAHAKYARTDLALPQLDLCGPPLDLVVASKRLGTL